MELPLESVYLKVIPTWYYFQEEGTLKVIPKLYYFQNKGILK